MWRLGERRGPQWGAAVATGSSHVTPTLPRLRKSDRRIFHTKASLQKLSAKVSGAGGPAESPSSGDAGGHGVAPSAPSPSPALPVPAVLGAAGRAVEAARGGAERVRLCPGLCHSPPGALPARGAARRHAGRTCPRPATSPPARVPHQAAPRCSGEGSARAGAGLVALGGPGLVPRGRGLCWAEGSHPLSSRRWTVTSMSGCGSTCRWPAGPRWRPAGPHATGSRALRRHPRG